jgi:predicted NBD/HSP70 family sugar kinase
MIMEMVRGAGQISRAELSRASGLSKPTVSSIVQALEDTGIVRVAGCAQGRAGRAPVLFEIGHNFDWVLGGDIGGGRARLAISRADAAHRLTLDGQLTAARGGQRGSQLAGMIRGLSEKAGVATSRLAFAAFALSQAGDESQHHADYVASRDALNQVLGSRYTIERAASMAALAEYRHRSGEPPRSLAFVSVGARIDLGLMLSGQVHRGAHYQPGRQSRGGTSRPEGSAAQCASVIAQFLRQLIKFVDPELIMLGGPMAAEPGFLDMMTVLARQIAGDQAAGIEASTLADPVLSGCVALAADEAWHRVLAGLGP